MLVQAGISRVYYIEDYKNDYETLKKLNICIPIEKIWSDDEYLSFIE